MSRVYGYNQARYPYPDNKLTCVKQRQLALGSLNTYTSEVSVAQELWQHSALLFLLLVLKINIVLSSPQKGSTDFYNTVEL